MAENDAADRTEKPSQKRLDKAREQGNVPRSRDLSTAAVVLVAGLGLWMLGGRMGSNLHTLMQTSLSLTREQTFNEQFALQIFGNALLQALWDCAPILGLTLLAALCAPLAVGGWNLTFTALAPDFTRLNPITGLGRMFAPNNAVELAKAFAKFAVVGVCGLLFLKGKTAELLGLGAEPLKIAIRHAVQLSGSALLMLACGLVLIAAVDVPWQLFQYNKRLRMSKEELRQEHKETEGSPEMKGRIRRAQQELARRRMMEDVPKADVIVTNPTHFAVALRYDDQKMRAPIVVAKGADVVAARIREVARENLVPIFEAPPLARALYKNVDIGAEIPATLYVAVAQVLTYVYNLRAARRNGATPPQPPTLDQTLDQTKH